MRGVIFLWLMFASPVLYCGCGGPRIDVPPPGTYSPLAAVSLGVAATDATPSPGPSPTPTPGKRENCNGTGKLGDGTITVPCPVCGGDGRTDKSETNIVPAMPPLTKADCPQCKPADVDAVFDTLVPRQPIRSDEPIKSKPSVSEGGTATGGVRPHSVSPPVVLDERPQRRGVLRGGLFGRRGGG